MRGFFDHFGLDWRNAHHGFTKTLQPDTTCQFNSLEFFPDAELVCQHEWIVEATVSDAVALMSVNGEPVAATIDSEIRGADGRIAGHVALSDSAIGELLDALAPEIRHLGIFGFDALEKLDPVAKLGDLITLSLAQCDGISDIRPLAALEKLRSLDLSGLHRLSDISALGKCSLLRRLIMNSCDTLEDLGALETCAGLESLDLFACREIKCLEPLRAFSSLRKLDLFQCSKVEDFSPIASLCGLVNLKVSHNSSFNDLELLSGLTELRELDISRIGFRNLPSSGTNLSELSALKQLEVLKLRSWFKLEDISILAGLRNIELVDLQDCVALRDLSPLAGLPNLTTLVLSGCRSLRDLNPLLSIQNLKRVAEFRPEGVVDLGGCEALEDLTPLSKLVWITDLNLGRCRLIETLKPLYSLANLESLNLHGCVGVSNLVPLSSLGKLTKLDLRGAKRIRSLEPLREVTALRDLECDFHPAQAMEIVAHAAWCRRDTFMIENSGREWGIEATACAQSLYPDFESFMVTLCRAFSLLGNHELSTLAEGLLGHHPELSSAPWKAWWGGTLQSSGLGLYRQRVERVSVDSMFPGMIGGACATLPLEEDPAWSVQWLAKLERARLKDARALLGVAPEICLAYVRLADLSALGRWTERFTDPSDPAALDPVHAALAGYELASGNLSAAESHTFAITLSTHRDTALKKLVTSFADLDLDRASIQLLMIDTPSIREELALWLAIKPGACQEILHRLVVAMGSSSESLSKLLATIPDSLRNGFLDALSGKLQPDRRTTLRNIAAMLNREADKYCDEVL